MAGLLGLVPGEARISSGGSWAPSPALDGPAVLPPPCTLVPLCLRLRNPPSLRAQWALSFWIALSFRFPTEEWNGRWKLPGKRERETTGWLLHVNLSSRGSSSKWLLISGGPHRKALIKTPKGKFWLTRVYSEHKIPLDSPSHHRHQVYLALAEQIESVLQTDKTNQTIFFSFIDTKTFDFTESNLSLTTKWTHKNPKGKSSKAVQCWQVWDRDEYPICDSTLPVC